MTAPSADSVWFISDLHLDIKRPQIIQAFTQLLRDAEGQASSLYILGDLFEFWIGDDIVDQPMGQLVGPLLGTLKQLSDSGTQLYFMHGNRDFLIGERFSEMTGCELLPEQHVIELNGEATLLMHGDTLCTDDLEYQELRKMFYDMQRREEFLALPFDERLKEGQRIRDLSKEKASQKSQEIMDVNQHAVEQTMRDNGVQQLIHGHTHRPAVHEFTLADKPAKRIVLGDWYQQASSLKIANNSFEFDHC